MRELIAAVAPVQFDLDDTISIDGTFFCRVRMGANHDTSEWEQLKALKPSPMLEIKILMINLAAKTHAMECIQLMKFAKMAKIIKFEIRDFRDEVI